LQVRIWERYQDQGVVVWGIATRENEERVRSYAERLGVTFPVLLDETGEVDRLYDLAFAFPTGAYPQDFVVGTDGRVVYASNEPDVEAIERAVQDELAE
jgi:peroxiredoxin